jgi:hypothetical protein
MIFKNFKIFKKFLKNYFEIEKILKENLFEKLKKILKKSMSDFR